MSLTSHILMIRPVRFGYNAETAVNNAFQVKGDGETVQEQALQEFDAFVEKLGAKGIHVTVMDDTPEPHTPDSIFPNNWASFHEDGSVFFYPMFALNRRLERKESVKQQIAERFTVNRTTDLSVYEADNLFLEGTGSMVLDRQQRLAYACLSPRTDERILMDFCDKAGYQPVTFSAVDQNGRAIYHTNVMMCVGNAYVVICLDSVKDVNEKNRLTQTIQASGKTIVPISFDQMNHFAGNMLQLQNDKGEKFLVMSSQAYRSLIPAQVALLESFNAIIHSDLSTIESNGGGSARCMMAEVFLPPKS
jgi:hypothetical protein